MRSAVDPKGSKFLLPKVKWSYSAEMVIAVNGISIASIVLATGGRFRPQAGWTSRRPRVIWVHAPATAVLIMKTSS
jgi:hypothetical protein